MPEETGELPEMKGPGVEKLVIPAIAKAIKKYERLVAQRSAISPEEKDAKLDILAYMIEHKDKLPKNHDGIPFYRHDGRDYLLEESLKRKKVDTDVD